MSCPDRRQALKMLEEGKKDNREMHEHAVHAALAAEHIALKCGLNGEKAYSMGLLHDIGRNYTEGQFQHITEGYKIMNERGYGEISRICLTHSFPVQNIYSYVGKMDICLSEQEKYQNILQSVVYDDYDKLIQLCDSLATSQGFVLPEQRFVALVFKYGFNEFTVERWKAILNLKEYFGRKIGEDICFYMKEKFGKKCLY